MSRVTSDPARVGVRVSDSFDGLSEELVAELDDRLDWGVSADPASGAERAVFTDDPERVRRITDDTLVVVTTSAAVARAATETAPSVPVVRWDADDPPWAYLTERIEAAVDAEPDTGGVSHPVPTPGETEDLAARLASYEQLMDSLGDAVYVLDDRGHFVYVNDAMAELTGYDCAEIVGQPPGVIKTDEAVQEAEDALAGMLSSEGPSWASLELDIVCEDGSRVPVEDHMTLLPYDEELRGTVGVLRDVTTQKRREAMFDGLLSATHRMMAADSPVAIAGIAAETAAETLDQELTTIRFYSDGELVPVATTESTRESLPPRPRYEPGEGGVGEAFATGETVERFDDVADGSLDTALYLPMGDRGTITVGSRDGSLAEQDRYFAELLAATTERALDRAARERSLRRYQALVEQIDDLAFAVDDDREFALLTDPFAEALGYDAETLDGERIDRIDTGVVDSVLDEVMADGADASPVLREGTLRRRTGEELPVRVHATPVSTAAFDGAVVSVDDISDLLSAREAVERTRDRFGGLFGALTDPVVELRLPDRSEPSAAEIVRVNDEFETLCRVDESDADTLGELSVPTAVADQLQTATERALADGDGERTEVTVQTGGQTRHFVVRDVPYEVDDATHAFVVFTEVTALKRRETHTAVLTRILRHNLRNEISVVRGFVDQLARETDGHDHAVGRIDEAAEHLVTLSETAGVIQEILQSDETVKRPVDLERVVRKAVDDALARHERAQAEIDTVGTEPVVATEYLEHAVAELVDNAVSHNPANEPSVSVSVERGPAATTILIADDSPPIPEVEWAVVTDRQEITQLQHGSGIGLWLVRWVVDDHGGTLELRENDDDGTTVAMRLPHTDAEPAHTDGE